MKIDKVGGSDSECIIPDPGNYEDEINHIAISHERTRRRNEAITDAEQSILRSEFGKLMRIARISRQWAIYDATAAAQTFSAGKRIYILEEKEDFSENEEKWDPPPR